MKNYVHFRYSDDGGATFSEGKGAYIGRCVSDIREPPEDPKLYSWSQISKKRRAPEPTEAVIASTPEYSASKETWFRECTLQSKWVRERQTHADGAATYTTPERIR